MADDMGSGRPSAPAQKSHFVLVWFISSANLLLGETTWSIFQDGTCVTRSCKNPPWKLFTSRPVFVGFGMRDCTFSATGSSRPGGIALPVNGSVTTWPLGRERRVLG